MPKKILTIAGSDTLAGGGLLTDIKTFEDYGHFGMTVITCIATVNEKQEFVLENLPPLTIQAQLDTIKNQTTIDAIKIGLLNSLEVIDLVANFIDQHPGIPVILDPVLAFKESSKTINNLYIQRLIDKLFRRSTIITPNLTEASLLSNQSIETVDEMNKAGQELLNLGANAVIIKGGQRFPGRQAFDLYLDHSTTVSFQKEKLTGHLVNGAGCTLASAITAELVNGVPLSDAVKNSKNYVYEAIQHGIALNDVFGNVWHNSHRLKAGVS